MKEGISMEESVFYSDQLIDLYNLDEVYGLRQDIPDGHYYLYAIASPVGDADRVIVIATLVPSTGITHISTFRANNATIDEWRRRQTMLVENNPADRPRLIPIDIDVFHAGIQNKYNKFTDMFLVFEEAIIQAAKEKVEKVLEKAD